MKYSANKIIEVGCAIIRHQGRILIAQRKPDVFLGNYWEFPGGKREPNESIEECLAREVEEELGVKVKASKLLCEVRHTYPDKDLKLCFWFCDWQSGTACKKDCQDFRWVTPNELPNFKFPPADDDILKDILANQKKYFH